MNSLTKRLLKAAGKDAVILEDSKYLDYESIPTKIPAMNMAISGSFKTGINPGITQVIGESRTFKTGFMLFFASEFQKYYDRKGEESIILHLDSEFGSDHEDFNKHGIDQSRVIHLPFTNVDDLKIKTVQFLEGVQMEDHVFIMIDSISQTASAKEMTDAEKGEIKQDMTRARALNSFFRSITTTCRLKKIPVYVINSFYENISNQYADVIVKGGKQGFLSSDTILYISKRKLRDKDRNLIGFDFMVKTFKSRVVREGCIFPITITYEGGYDVWSALFAMGKLSGHIYSEKQGWYKRSYVPDDKSWRLAQMDDDFYMSLLNEPSFVEWAENYYRLTSTKLSLSEAEIKAQDEAFNNDIINPETGEVLNAV